MMLDIFTGQDSDDVIICDFDPTDTEATGAFAIRNGAAGPPQGKAIITR